MIDTRPVAPIEVGTPVWECPPLFVHHDLRNMISDLGLRYSIVAICQTSDTRHCDARPAVAGAMGCGFSLMRVKYK